MHLVDKLSGTGVPHADLYVVLWSRVDSDRLEWDLLCGATQIDNAFARLGQHHRADEQGVVRIKRPQESVRLFARNHQSQAFLDMEISEESDWKMELEQEQFLRVRVLDANGQPQSQVPVALHTTNPPFPMDFATQASRADGVAVFSGMNWLVAMSTEGGLPLAVRLGIPLSAEQAAAPSAVARLANGPLPDGPLELVLPPTGSVVFRFLDVDGQLLTGSSFAMIQIMEDAATQGFEIGAVRLQGEDGLVELTHVGLGLELIGLMRFGFSSIGQAVPFTGPVRPGQRVEVEVRRQQSLVLIGSLHDQEGGALAMRSLQAQLSPLQGQGAQWPGPFTATDERGAFSIELIREWFAADGPPPSMTLKLDGENGTSFEAVVSLAEVLEPGVHNLGEITMQLPPLLVGGVVVDASGSAINGARVNLSVVDPEPFSDQWTAVCDANGRFQIHGSSSHDHFQMYVYAEDLEGESLSVSKGTDDLRIALKANAFISGYVLLDPGIPSASLNLRLEQPFQSANMPLYGDNGKTSFRIETSTASNATLKILTELEELLFQLKDLDLALGHETKPESLNPLDLRGRLLSYHLDVSDESDKPLSATIVSGEFPDAARFAEWRGRFHFAAVAAEVKVTIHSTGYRSMETVLVPGFNQVHLVDGIPVQVRLTDTSALPEDWEVYAIIEPKGYREIGFDKLSAALSAQGEAELKVDQAGEFTMKLQLVKDMDGFAETRVPLAERPILVEDVIGTQAFPVALTEDELERALKSVADQ